MKFRYHRGTLQESLTTMEEFNMKKIYQDNDFDRKYHCLTVTHYGYDDRIHKELWIVQVQDIREDSSSKWVLGFLQ